MGLVYATQGQAQQAMDMFAAASAADPSYVEAFNNLGVLQKDVGLVHEVDSTALASVSFCAAVAPII